MAGPMPTHMQARASSISQSIFRAMPAQPRRTVVPRTTRTRLSPPIRRQTAFMPGCSSTKSSRPPSLAAQTAGSTASGNEPVEDDSATLVNVGGVLRPLPTQRASVAFHRRRSRRRPSCCRRCASRRSTTATATSSSRRRSTARARTCSTKTRWPTATASPACGTTPTCSTCAARRSSSPCPRAGPARRRTVCRRTAASRVPGPRPSSPSSLATTTPASTCRYRSTPPSAPSQFQQRLDTQQRQRRAPHRRNCIAAPHRPGRRHRQAWPLHHRDRMDARLPPTAHRTG